MPPLLRSAPLRGLREPALGAGLAVAAAVLALATAGTPLYRVAVGNAALEGAIEGFHEESLGLTLGAYAQLDARLFASTDRLLRDEAAAAGLAAPPFTTLRAVADAVPEGVDAFAAGEDAGAGGRIPPRPLTRPIQLFARDGVTEHLPEPQACPGAGDGVWVSSRLARSLDLEACGTLHVAGEDRQASVRIAGLYRDLLDVLDTPIWDAPDPLPDGSPIARYWQLLGELVVGLTPDGTPAPQPPLVVAEPHDLAALGISRAAALPVHQRWTWPFPLEGAWYLDVREASERYRDFATEARRLDRPTGAALLGLAGLPQGVTATTLLPTVADRTDALVTAVGTSMQPLGMAAQLAAALVVAAAGIFDGRRRRSERALLAAQGVGPAGAGMRAALESLLPVALGTVAGVAGAVALVRAVAPSEPPGAALVVSQVPAVAAWAVAAVGLLAVTAAWQASSWRLPMAPTGEQRRARPWEVVPLVLAAASYWVMRSRGEVLLETGPGAGGASTDLSYVVFPLLLLVACGAFAARMLPRAGEALRPMASSAPASVYLAVRRLALAPPAAALLVAVAALGTGTLVYAAAVSASSEHATSTSLGAVHGAPTVADLTGRGVLDGLPAGVTVVARILAVMQPHGIEVDLLTVDPETFAEVAFWQDRFADRPLDELLAALGRAGEGEVPLLLVGAPAGERPALETSRYRVPVEVVGRPAAFPGMSGQRPIAVAATGTLVEVVAASGQSSLDEELMLSRSRQLWTVHPPDAVPRLLAGQPVQAGLASTVDQLRHERPQLLAAGWALGYLQGVGAVAGLLGLVALVLYLYGQQRTRAVSFALLSRMGLRRRGHRRAIALEIGALVATALLAGLVPATVAAWAVVTAVDVLPRVGPAPELLMPWPVVGALLLVASALCVVAAWASQRAADRARPGELLRTAD